MLVPAVTGIRLLVLCAAVGFFVYQIANIIDNFGYHMMIFAGSDNSYVLKAINIAGLGIAGLIVALLATTAFAPAGGIDDGPAEGRLGRSRALWHGMGIAFRAGVGAIVLGILLTLFLPLIGVDLRLRWVAALCVVLTAAVLFGSGERRRALLGHLRVLARPGRRGLRNGRRTPLAFCRAAGAFVESHLHRIGSHLATRIERLAGRPLPAAGEQWRDGVAVAVFAGIKFYLLITLGIYSWQDNDGVGYIGLAAQFRHWATWVSVPDLANTVLPLSLLRMPGYPLLILAMQAAAGDAWMAVLIALQLAVSLVATFVLYRAIWCFCGFWLLAIAGAAWFASSYVGYFERMVLSDSLTISLFTILLCAIGLAAFRERGLGAIALASVAVAFPALFLLREANLLFAVALAPLLYTALAPKRRFGKLAIAYAPLVGVFLLIGAWQQYRTGYFLITTGGQGNPIEALVLVDKITPVLDRDSPVDRTLRSVTADKTSADVERDSWSLVFEANQRLAEELHLTAPQLARLLLNRYLAAWRDHPREMLAYMGRSQNLVRIAGVSPFIYDDPRLPEKIREYYSYISQQVIAWGLVTFPVLWFGLFVAVAPLRQTALVALALALAALLPIAFYSAMFLESRYVLPALGPILLVVALSVGAAQPRLMTRQAFARRRLAPPQSTPLSG